MRLVKISQIVNIEDEDFPMEVDGQAPMELDEGPLCDQLAL